MPSVRRTGNLVTPWGRRCLAVLVTAIGIAAAEGLLYRAGVQDPMSLLGVAALVALYAWVFLWR